MKLYRLLIAALVLLVASSVTTAPLYAADRSDRDRNKEKNERSDPRDRGQVIERRDTRVIEKSREKSDDRYRSSDRDRQPQIIARPKGYVLDKNYSHNRYYPPRGYRTPKLSTSHRVFPYRNKKYYFDRGVWYLYSGVSFVVVLPPVGLVVPYLPPYYTTVWVGSVPYYYAGGVYYVWRPIERVYVVTDPPPETAVSEEPAAPEKLFIYPKQGQSAEQQATDRYQCHRWAKGETGFDPTRADGNVEESAYFQKRADYQRAMKACLEARGYSVK
jgi:hypothetical protein